MSEKPVKAAAKKAPRRVVKKAKVAPEGSPEDVSTKEAVAPVAETPPSKPEKSSIATSAPEASWPEPERVSSNDVVPAKRKRRRKKKNHAAVNESSEDATGNAEEDKDSAQSRTNPVSNPASRHAFDKELVAKRAWKIFLAEVSEEGLALINEHEARDISRRSFRVAEIFTEEQMRRR